MHRHLHAVVVCSREVSQISKRYAHYDGGQGRRRLTKEGNERQILRHSGLLVDEYPPVQQGRYAVGYG